MTETRDTPTPVALELLPYHRAICDFLKSEDREVWNWFASHKVRDEQAEQVRFELLKSTYRVERDTQPGLYAAAESVAGQLGLEVPVTLYQAQNPQGANASLAWLPDEAHIILHGPLTTQLAEPELRALLGHELSHLLLWRGWDGELMIADQVLAALTNDRHAHPAHFASARLLGLYNEIFCDRGALAVSGQAHVVVSMLVKVVTGVQQVSAASYLRQAEEIFARESAKTEGLTHPEAFIRARAVKLWADNAPDADPQIVRMIEGLPALGELDLLGQRRLAKATRGLLEAFLQPSWFQTDAVLAQARLYFEDFAPAKAAVPMAAWGDGLSLDTPSIRDYCCFVLLDFVTADRDLEELPLAAALTASEHLGIKPRFVELARQELRLRKNQLEKVDREKAALLNAAARATPAR